MSTNTDDLEERVAHIEGTVEQMDTRLAELRTRFDERFDTLGAKIDDRFETLDSKIDIRFGTVEERMDQLSGDVDRIDGKIDDARRDVRNWLVLVVLSMSAVVGTLQLLL